MELQNRELSIRMRGGDVALLQTELAELNFDIPVSEIERSHFGTGTRDAVNAFQGRHGLPVTGVVDERTAVRINAEVDQLALSEVVVVGRIVSRSRAGVGGLSVVVVDKIVGDGDVELAQTTTSDSGRYAVKLSGATLSGRGKQLPDLQAKAYRDDRYLGASAVSYNASNLETLTIFLDESADKALDSEHETLVAHLAAQFRGNLRDLKENGEREDITHLANKTGWDARAVALAALAEQFSARTTTSRDDTGIEPAFFYALFRAGLPANEHTLYQNDPRAAGRIFEQAIEQGVIPADLRERIPQAVERFGTQSARHMLDGPALAGLSTLKQMLSVSLGDDDRRHKEFSQLYTRHRGDPPRFWATIREAFGETAHRRLRIDGQLGYLTLNNAPLIKKLHDANGRDGLADTVELVRNGYYRDRTWRELLGDGDIPEEVPGRDDAERRGRYAELLAAKIRLSYPTAVVAAMVNSGETVLTDRGLTERVHRFLTEQQDSYEIGVQPVRQYLARNTDISVDPEVTNEIARIERVYQITASDTAMNALLAKGVDSAYAVVRYDPDEFVAAFSDDLGGEADARLIYAKAHQVHNTVLNIATSYLVAGTASPIGAHSAPKYVNPSSKGPGESSSAATDVIAYPTLEGLFGELDFCACEHCRSILSPAAYLVDLLVFCDPETNAKENPQAVLLERRPDIQHLPLTCDNTNTPLPYIDLVNETLEFFVTNNLSLASYEGHSTGGDFSPEELLASPQFITGSAYETLAGRPLQPGDPLPVLPPTSPLPFHRPLENLRRYFDKLDIPLPGVMEALRVNDDLDRQLPADPANPVEYGWRDILMEELGLSRAEHKILSNYDPDPPVNSPLSLAQLYGFPAATTEVDVVLGLSKVKTFARRLEISYEDIIDILKTRFVNPTSTLIPKLERLGVPFSTLKALKDGTISDAEFDALTPPGLDASEYGGDITAWVKNAGNYANIMGMVTIANPTDEDDICSFEHLEFRYANPDNTANTLGAFEFLRLIRFIRLWRKLGWSIEHTDKAITTLYPPEHSPDDPVDAVNRQRLDAGFLVLLPRLAIIKRVMAALRLRTKRDLLPLLACFAPIDTHGTASLYQQLFLRPALDQQDTVFADNGYGAYLTDAGQRTLDHVETLRAALGLTDSEFVEISQALALDENSPLSLVNVSALFRWGWLARKLRLSVRELVLLTKHTGTDPFSAPDAPAPHILRLAELLNRLRDTSMKPVEALYIIWNQDISGRSAPDDREILDFARTLRSELGAIEGEFALADDPDGAIARARMASVYDEDATNLFFGLLDNTFVTDVPYSHDQPELAQLTLDAAPGRIAYDHFRKRLAFRGVMSQAIRDALKIGVPLALEVAADALYDQNSHVVGGFFNRYPELSPLHDAYVTSNDPEEVRRSAVLAQFLPELKRRRKRQQALQAISAVAKTELAVARDLLDHVAVIHALNDDTRPVLDDLTAAETCGLSAKFYFAATATGPVGDARDAEAHLYYSTEHNPLPPNGNIPGSSISAVWNGYLEAPENGFYNLSIEADPGATIALSVNGDDIELWPAEPTPGGASRNTKEPLELRAGTLYPITIQVEGVKDLVNVRWQGLMAVDPSVPAKGRGWEAIPARYLYAATLSGHLHQAYVRFLKTVALATRLKLTSAEIRYFATRPEYQIGGKGWLNGLPVFGDPQLGTSSALFNAFIGLLDFAYLKSELTPNDERLLTIVKDPENATDTSESLLYTVTRWEPGSLDALLDRFGKSKADLANANTFRQVYDGYAPVKKSGASATAVIRAATNEPNPTMVRDFQAALRARYEAPDWLNVLRPINDEMRGLQRDALVAYILHQMGADPLTAHIDTAEKLFEYFLMDVQMDPCMQTSRIRHALSSLQLFIERCLMNLETRVAPSSIKANLWQWMKRYRVWEANRKVFIWPENWLEPELRDDQSPFFKETMSELLQSDITEEKAATALLNYLYKLDEVAKLEPCGIHYAENDSGANDDVVHVVARTAGANRKYFYRRREYGYWTPWEQIKLDIEDNPVLPVVWKGRLFLFWIRILKGAKSNASAPFSGDKELAELKASDLVLGEVEMQLRVVLCWSEYYNNAWQPAKTSDINKPAWLDELANELFDRSKLWMSATASDAYLRINIVREDEGGASFVLHNTHSLPQWGNLNLDKVPRNLDVSGFTLDVEYLSGSGMGNVTRSVLKTNAIDRALQPQHKLNQAWRAPFFYEDSRHIFYVTTTRSLTLVPAWDDYGVLGQTQDQSPKIPPMVLVPVEKIPDRVGPVVVGPPVVNPAPIERFVSEDAFIDKGIGSIGTVTFGDKQIGIVGALKGAGETHGQ